MCITLMCIFTPCFQFVIAVIERNHDGADHEAAQAEHEQLGGQLQPSPQLPLGKCIDCMYDIML